MFVWLGRSLGERQQEISGQVHELQRQVMQRVHNRSVGEIGGEIAVVSVGYLHLMVIPPIRTGRDTQFSITNRKRRSASADERRASRGDRTSVAIVGFGHVQRFVRRGDTASKRSSRRTEPETTVLMTRLRAAHALPSPVGNGGTNGLMAPPPPSPAAHSSTSLCRDGRTS